MRAFLDIIILNLAAIAAFTFRQNFGDFVTKQAPSVYLAKYLQVLVLLNIIYLFVFWVLGLYDKRQKRALLEEFILIFGVLSTGTAVMITFFFLGRLWWMSRIVLFLFWGLSITLLCLSRVLIPIKRSPAVKMSFDTDELRQKMKSRKDGLERHLNDSVSIIIVSFNAESKIKGLLDSLDKASAKVVQETIVVDNHSLDGTAEFVSQYYPRVKLIKNAVNLGYSKAVNVGLKAAKSEYCMVLNPDIAVIPGAIEILLDYMVKHPKTGVGGSKLLNDDGTLQYSVRRFLDLRTYLYRFTPLRGLMAGSAIERFYLMQDWDHRDDRLVDWVLGGCMMLRKSALSEVGYLDEGFFLYFEDVDICYRMWERGWQVAYVAEAAMFHKHMRTSANRLFNRATWEHFKSLFLFIKKHGFRLPKNSPSSME
jgi:hypothetical protein